MMAKKIVVSIAVLLTFSNVHAGGRAVSAFVRGFFLPPGGKAVSSGTFYNFTIPPIVPQAIANAATTMFVLHTVAAPEKGNNKAATQAAKEAANQVNDILKTGLKRLEVSGSGVVPYERVQDRQEAYEQVASLLSPGTLKGLDIIYQGEKYTMSFVGEAFALTLVFGESEVHITTHIRSFPEAEDWRDSILLEIQEELSQYL